MAEGPVLRPLSDYGGTPGRPRRHLGAILAIGGLLLLVSLLLPWDHRHVPGGEPVTFMGWRAAPSMGLYGAVAVGLGLRLLVRFPGTVAKVTLFFLTALLVIALFAENTDVEGRSAALNIDPYFGPGVWLAVAGLVALVLATVLALRSRD